MKNKMTDKERRWWEALLVFNVVLYALLIIKYTNLFG